MFFCRALKGQIADLKEENKRLQEELARAERILTETSQMLLAYPGEGNAAYRVCNQKHYLTSMEEEEKKILDRRQSLAQNSI